MNGACYIKIDLGKTFFVHKIMVYYGFYTNWFKNATNWCTESEINYKECITTESSVDVSAYQGGTQQKSCGTMFLSFGLRQSDQIYTFICNVEADNVKLSKTSGRIAAYEIVVIGTGNN